MTTIGAPTRCDRCGAWHRPLLTCTCSHYVTQHEVDTPARKSRCTVCPCPDVEVA